MTADLKARIHRHYTPGAYNRNITAAARLCADSPTIRRKISGYVDGDGYIDFAGLSVDVDRSGWSGGEQRLIRFVCSLAGEGPEGMSNDWLIGEMLGFDPDNQSCVLEAFRYAVAGEER